MFEEIIERYIQDEETRGNAADMMSALHDGELDEASRLRNLLGKDIEMLRKIDAFRKLVKQCVGDVMLIDGKTPDEIIAIGKDIGGDDMDFSEELDQLNNPMSAEDIAASEGAKRDARNDSHFGVDFGC